jgi:regulator of protease activity HflC (stomatin/prohibitin superfamily)
MKKIILICLTSQMISSCAFVGVFIPPVKAWVAEWDGRAELAQADFSKQVQVQEAKGKEEAATYLANAEIARARGVAEANKIIGDSLRNNEAYLRWLYIDGIKEHKGSERIYIPTEAGMPILEARK